MNREIATAIGRQLEAGRPFVVATIISQQGSTPRLPGTQMVIAADGTLTGTVGGGLLEAAVTERAGQVLQAGSPQLMNFELTARAMATMDMICGGRAEVLVDRIDPAAASGRCLSRWCRLVIQGGPGSLLTVLSGPAEGTIQTRHFIIEPGSEEAVDHSQTLAALRQKATQISGPAVLTVVEAGDLRGVVEPVRSPRTVFIFGAGHVSQPTAHLAAMVGFKVVVLDDRGEFAQAARFPDAEAVAVLDDYQRAMADLPVAADSFIVIVTRGHLHDQTVLAQALKTPAAYIGMIGSRTKRATIYHNLHQQGFGDADLARVASPIGLAIGAQTPAEIAVSIVAEMIQKRRELDS